MDIQATATGSPLAAPVSKWAFMAGEPLTISSSAPNSLSAALQAAAREYPNKGIQVIDRDRQETFLSYATLLHRATCVLTGLKNRGLNPGAKVLLQVDALPDYFAAFWGCVLGGFVPVTVAIAPTYQERNGVVDKLQNTWQLLGKPLILTTRRLEGALTGLAAILPLEGLSIHCVEELLESPPAEAFHPANPEEIVFIQLSSGSTGIPKCIQQTHRAILAHVHSSKTFNDYTSSDITLNWLPMDHVVPLLTFHLKDTCLGCEQIHVATELVLAEPLLWPDLLQRFQVTHTWAPNFGFKLASDRMARSPGKHWDLSHVKFFMNAGEQVTLPVVREFLSATAPFGVGESAMQPAFGMAEVCTCMTYANHFDLKTGARRFLKASLNHDLEPAVTEDADTVEFVSLGRVSPGIAIRITDTSNDILPEGRIGRLQIKGPVVTPGYFRNDAANHEAFVGNGWFNTGDLGFIQDGELFLTGREKETIIIRGAKFYCYEIEDVINRIPGVEPTFVAACGTNDANTGTERLAIFFSPAGVTDELSVAQAICRQVTARLGITPEFVVPIPKNAFPKTTSGKLQRTQLKQALESGAYRERLEAFAALSSADQARAPASKIEDQVFGIWQEVMGSSRVSMNAHLFELGGDSLKATRIISRIGERLQLEFPLHLLFSGAGTVEGMAKWISENLNSGRDVPPAIQPAPRTASLPLSYSQLRLWLAEQIDPGTSLYNIGRTYRLQGPLDFPALERALQQIVNRHDILRTVYRLEDMPVQEIRPNAETPLPRHDLAHLPTPERARVVANLLALEISRPFNLVTGPLLRAKLLRLGTEEHLLVLTFHQIVIDGWSLGVFARELAQLYSGLSTGDPDPLPHLPVQYADYATWQQRWFADAALDLQSAFWQRKLSEPIAPLRFVRQRARTPVSNASATECLVVEKGLLEKLRTFNAEENVTSYMTLLTVYQLLLAYWTGARDLMVGSPESGRRRLETENLLGCFVNLLALDTRLEPNDTFRTVLSRVRETSLEVFAHADVPFEKIQALASPAIDGLRHRLFQVWFGPIDSLAPFSMGGLQVQPRPVFPPVGQFDLSCYLAEQAETITCWFEYNKDLFTPAQMHAMLEQFRALLSRMLDHPNTMISQAFRDLRHDEATNQNTT